MNESPWQPYLPYNALLCRYDEIGTKGKNRHAFEKRLWSELRRRLAPMGEFSLITERGRIFLLPKDEKAHFSEEDLLCLRHEVPLISGLASLSPGFVLQPELAAIESCVMTHFPALQASFRRHHGEAPCTYAMRCRRSDKGFPMSSQEIEIYFAGKLCQQFPDMTIDLRQAKLQVGLEIRQNLAFVFFERIAGAGGLPSGISGNVLALLSGGFDSPVACYQMMRRGCQVNYITFHSSPYTPPATLTKVADIARRLNSMQNPGKLLAVNLLPAQKAIRDLCSSRFRTVLYRRMMMRIASQVAYKLGDRALVSGDNLGQVASQTLENLAVIEEAGTMMLLRPLICADKWQIMKTAEKIGTWELSSQDVPDSCTVFAPPDPATKTHLPKIKQEEKALDLELLLQQCLQSTCFIDPQDYSETPAEFV